MTMTPADLYTNSPEPHSSLSQPTSCRKSDMYAAQISPWGGSEVVQRYRTVYGRVMMLATVGVLLVLMWQGRVFFERQSTVLLTRSCPPVSPPPPADSNTIIAQAANRVAKIVIDADTTKIVEWNAGAERMLGWPADEIVGKDISTLLPSEASSARHKKLLQDENVRNNLLSKTVEMPCWTYTSTKALKQFNVRVRGWKSGDRYYWLCELEDTSTLINIVHGIGIPPGRLD